MEEEQSLMESPSTEEIRDARANEFAPQIFTQDFSKTTAL